MEGLRLALIVLYALFIIYVSIDPLGFFALKASDSIGAGEVADWENWYEQELPESTNAVLAYQLAQKLNAQSSTTDNTILNSVNALQSTAAGGGMTGIVASNKM